MGFYNVDYLRFFRDFDWASCWLGSKSELCPIEESDKLSGPEADSELDYNSSASRLKLRDFLVNVMIVF